jgi:hypothetical protein
MNISKRNALVARLSKEEEPLLVPVEEFFDGNDDPGSIGCNLTEHPGIDTFRKSFAALAARADVRAIYALISELDSGPDSWPFSDTVVVFGAIPLEELKRLLADLGPDEVVPAAEFGLGPEITTRHDAPALIAWWD